MRLLFKGWLLSEKHRCVPPSSWAPEHRIIITHSVLRFPFHLLQVLVKTSVPCQDLGQVQIDISLLPFHTLSHQRGKSSSQEAF